MRAAREGREGGEGEAGRVPAPAQADGRGMGPPTGLQELRSEIEAIDRELIRLIAERVALARQVGTVKRKAGMPALDPAREAAVVRHAGNLARQAGVSDEDVRYIFWHLIGLSRRAQMEEE